MSSIVTKLGVRGGVVSSANTASLDWDSPSALTGTVKRRPASGCSEGGDFYPEVKGGGKREIARKRGTPRMSVIGGCAGRARTVRSDGVVSSRWFCRVV